MRQELPKRVQRPREPVHKRFKFRKVPGILDPVVRAPVRGRCRNAGCRSASAGACAVVDGGAEEGPAPRSGRSVGSGKSMVSWSPEKLAPPDRPEPAREVCKGAAYTTEGSKCDGWRGLTKDQCREKSGPQGTGRRADSGT